MIFINYVVNSTSCANDVIMSFELDSLNNNLNLFTLQNSELKSYFMGFVNFYRKLKYTSFYSILSKSRIQLEKYFDLADFNKSIELIQLYASKYPAGRNLRIISITMYFERNSPLSNYDVVIVPVGFNGVNSYFPLKAYVNKLNH